MAGIGFELKKIFAKKGAQNGFAFVFCNNGAVFTEFFGKFKNFFIKFTVIGFHKNQSPFWRKRQNKELKSSFTAKKV